MDDIKALIKTELEAFDAKFALAVKSNVPLLDRIMHYIVKRKGKQIRPMFVFLAARLAGGVTDTTYRTAALVELLHTATLVHDDVVDDAMERRGMFSINALWKNKIAVLVGDYLLSKGLLLSLDNRDFEILQILSTAVKEMSEGELMQMEKTRRLDIKEDLYVEVMIRHLERHRAGVEAAIAGSGRSLENQLFGVGAWMLRRPPVDVVRMTHADLPALPPDYGKLLESAFQRCVFHPIEAIFQDAAAKGILRFQDIRVLTRIFFSNMAALASARKYLSRHSSEQEVLSGCLDILLRGMLRGGRE